MTRKEYRYLIKINPLLNSITDHQGNGFVIKKGIRCIFLGKKGCILKNSKKPLDCRMFPIWFYYKNNKIYFKLAKFCPYHKKLSLNWVNKTQKSILKELKKWSKQDKSSYDSIPYR